MKLVTKPRVELVGRQVFDIEGVLKFLEEHGIEWPEVQNKFDSNCDLGDRDAEYIVEMAARLCYLSFGKKQSRSHEDHIKHLIRVGHGSCLEHAKFNFCIWNVSRSLTHELVRMRIGVAYSQLSQRYVDSSDCAFVVPPAIQELKEKEPVYYATWVTHMERSRELYSKFTEALYAMYDNIENKTERRKKANQAARSVLPNATETKIFVSLNGRSVRHLIELRSNPAADLEIRQLAVEVYKLMEKNFPLIVYGMKLIILPDGTEGVESEFKRV